MCMRSPFVGLTQRMTAADRSTERESAPTETIFHLNKPPVSTHSTIDKSPLIRSEESKMSDLPGWAKGENEPAPEPNLADKLVDEAAGVKPEESAGATPADTAGSTAGSDTPEDSGLASRALCFFRFLAVLTVLLALIVIGTNCYIIYDKYSEIKGELGWESPGVCLACADPDGRCDGLEPSLMPLRFARVRVGVVPCLQRCRCRGLVLPALSLSLCLPYSNDNLSPVLFPADRWNSKRAFSARGVVLHACTRRTETWMSCFPTFASLPKRVWPHRATAPNVLLKTPD